MHNERTLVRHKLIEYRYDDIALPSYYTLSGTMYNLVMLYSSLAFLLAIFVFFVCLYGRSFRIHRVRLGAVYNVSYSSWTRSFSIKQISIKLHCPRRDSPYWAIIAIDELEYTDTECQVSLQRCEAKLWIFPVLFRFTAGPWIAVTLRDFTVLVNSSTANPWWVAALRRNLLSTILSGETIRLAHSDTKLFLSSLTKSVSAYLEKVEASGLREDDSEPPEELRVRSALSQWHILLARNSRMYTFDDLKAELRRSWVGNRGSFVMIAEGCRWTKVPVFSQSQENYRKASTLWWVTLQYEIEHRQN